MTRTGLATPAMTLEMVNVLPLPVTPRSVWYLPPRRPPSVSCFIASGWSPAGLYSETSVKMPMGKSFDHSEPRIRILQMSSKRDRGDSTYIKVDVTPWQRFGYLILFAARKESFTYTGRAEPTGAPPLCAAWSC